MTFSLRRGYIALTAAILVGALVVVLVFAASVIAFLGRASAASSYYRMRSRSLAEACVSVARLRLSGNPAYAGNETVPVGTDSCTISSVTASSTQDIIVAQGAFQNAVTNLTVSVQASTLSLVSWQETQ